MADDIKIKEFLFEHRILNEDIDNEIERLERMKMKAYSISGTSMSGMPKAQSSPYPYDRTANLVSRIVDLENEIKELIKERDRQRKYIECIVRRLKKSGERAVLKMRYIDGEDWNDIQYMMFGSKKDFDEHYDNYKQRMFRLHNTAIDTLSKIKL